MRATINPVSEQWAGSRKPAAVGLQSQGTGREPGEWVGAEEGHLLTGLVQLGEAHVHVLLGVQDPVEGQLLQSFRLAVRQVAAALTHQLHRGLQENALHRELQIRASVSSTFQSLIASQEQGRIWIPGFVQLREGTDETSGYPGGGTLFTPFRSTVFSPPTVVALLRTSPGSLEQCLAASRSTEPSWA